MVDHHTLEENWFIKVRKRRERPNGDLQLRVGFLLIKEELALFEVLWVGGRFRIVQYSLLACGLSGTDFDECYGNMVNERIEVPLRCS